MAYDYEETCTRVAAFIEKERDTFVRPWSDLVAQPSISSTGEGIGECCSMLVGMMREIGIDAHVRHIDPHPVITGSLGSNPAKPTILLYAHYDVQPVGQMELWQSDPFVPEIRGDVLYGRGAADNKSPLAAHLMAAKLLVREFGNDLPVNLKFIFEGCEEAGSRGLPGFLKDHAAELRADFVFLSDGPKNEKKLPIIALGAKGCLHIDLELTALKQDAHSRYAPILPNAAWRMVALLNELKHKDKVLVPGFYDDVIPPSAEECALMNELPPVDEEIERIYGALPIYPQDEGYYVHLNMTPTFNISQIHSGHGAGVVPAVARASLDIRLVEGQSADSVYEKICRHIRNIGYDDVKVVRRSSVEPSKTPLDSPWVEIVRRVTGDVYGDYVLYPCRPSSAPDYLWTKILGLPVIQVRWSDADSNNHAPNEHQSISGYLQGIELTFRLALAVGMAATSSR